MTRNGRHGLVALGATIAVVALAAAGVTLVGHERESEQGAEPEFPTALGKHLEKLMEATPGNQGMAEEGPASGAEAAFLQRAYPEETISLAAGGRRAGRVRCLEGSAVPDRQGTPRARGSPSARARRSIPTTDLRNSFNYVPNDYVAGGRTTSIAISDTCKPGHCRLYITPAGGGIWRTKNALDRAAQLGVPRRDRSASTPPARSRSTRTTRPATRSTSARARRTSAAPAASRASGSTSRRTAATRGPARSAAPRPTRATRSPARASARSWSSPATRTRSTPPRRPPSAACLGRAVPASTRPVPGAAKWGLYKSTNGGATWTFIHNGSTNAADCTGDR